MELRVWRFRKRKKRKRRRWRWRWRRRRIEGLRDLKSVEAEVKTCDGVS